MTINSTGAVSLGGSTAGQSVNLELGRSATASINMNETAVRTLAGKASGAIAMSDFRGKSAATTYVAITSMSEYGSITKSAFPALPPNFSTNAYWAALNSNPNVEETSYCQGWPTFSRDICIADWGGILSGVQANPAYANLTKVEFYSAANALVQTIQKTSFTTYSAIGQTCIRIPGVLASLYSGNSPISGTKIRWYFVV